MERSRGAGCTNFEFYSDELRCVGGDYGQITLEGTTEAARVVVGAIVDAIRRGGCSARISAGVAIDDREEVVGEDWHAGLERQTQVDFGGRADRSSIEESMAPQEACSGGAASDSR